MGRQPQPQKIENDKEDPSANLNILFHSLIMDNYPMTTYKSLKGYSPDDVKADCKARIEFSNMITAFAKSTTTTESTSSTPATKPTPKVKSTTSSPLSAKDHNHKTDEEEEEDDEENIKYLGSRLAKKRKIDEDHGSESDVAALAEKTLKAQQGISSSAPERTN
ncbi:hypothetical protein M438DRAFT_354340 [Aureobasidium pullulans EXF-150]|uniref:Uncharacterized protein n=1 Tax=Aureobasidium pullulans EXF-150 TaxID=1043002 RepID=A0A074XIB8_AURPU|nr:uncharacterized protein M438DRAFT_354340 [Aureobasidium pullulans EXF-150]KEQ85238.1 hypothetical protein M438DRAFT_354340 [Aureobasidium pullulans EXF-150]